MHKTDMESIKHPKMLLAMLGASIVLFLVETRLVLIDQLSPLGTAPVSGITPTHPFVIPGVLLFVLIGTYALLLKTVISAFRNTYRSSLRENTRIRIRLKDAVFEETGDSTHSPGGLLEGWLPPVVGTGTWLKLSGQYTPPINVVIPIVLALTARVETFLLACTKEFFSSTAPTALLLFGLITVFVCRWELIQSAVSI